MLNYEDIMKICALAFGLSVSVAVLIKSLRRQYKAQAERDTFEQCLREIQELSSLYLKDTDTPDVMRSEIWSLHKIAHKALEEKENVQSG